MGCRLARLGGVVVTGREPEDIDQIQPFCISPATIGEHQKIDCWSKREAEQTILARPRDVLIHLACIRP